MPRRSAFGHRSALRRATLSTRPKDEEDTRRGSQSGRRNGACNWIPNAAKEAYFFDNRKWMRPFIGGYKFETQPGVANLDAAAMFFFLATGVTPAMDTQVVGEGSTYPWTAVDANGDAFEGGRNYRLHLPPHVPVATFWSVIVYDTQTRSMLQTDERFPSVSSQNKDLQLNADGSVDVYFGPIPPEGKQSNWVQTIPGKSWFTILRLYGHWSRGSIRAGDLMTLNWSIRLSRRVRRIRCSGQIDRFQMMTLAISGSNADLLITVMHKVGVSCATERLLLFCPGPTFR